MTTLNYKEFPRTAIYSVGNTESDGPFDIPFPFLDADTVQVFIDGVEEFDFVVTQDAVFSTGGNYVTLDAPVKNVVVEIVSNTGARRTTEDRFVIAELSKEIDRIFALLQERDLQMTRTVRIASRYGFQPVLEAKNRLIGIDENGIVEATVQKNFAEDVMNLVHTYIEQTVPDFPIDLGLVSDPLVNDIIDLGSV